MIQLEEEEIDKLIHDLIGVASIIKTVGDESISIGQRQILSGCETRLVEIRQHLLEVIKEINNNHTIKED